MSSLIRRILPAFLGFGLLAAPPLAQAQFTWITNYTYITITGYSGPGGAVVIPDWITGMSVTWIDKYSFRDRSDITSVHLPTNVVEIGQEAFSGCSGLTGISFPPGLGIYDFKAFYACSGLTNVVIPTNVWTVSSFAFGLCSNLTNFSVGSQNKYFTASNGVLFNKTMTNLVQYPCGRAGSYAIPSTVTNLLPGSFVDCVKLTSVSVPRGTTNMANLGAPPFQGCLSLTNITVDTLNPICASVDGVLFKKGLGTLLQFPPGKAGAWTIPGGVTNLVDYAFYRCANVISVTIPEGVTSLGVAVFSGCAGLTNITIPNSLASIPTGTFADCTGLQNVSLGAGVNQIGMNAFARCKALTNFTVDPTNSTFSSLDGVLFSRNRTVLYIWPPGKGGSYTVPAGVMSLADMAFSSCQGLTNVVVPNGVGYVGNSCFANSTNLITVSIGSGVTSIGSAAFALCSSLTDISVNPANPAYSSADGVLFNKSKTLLIRCPGAKTGSYNLPASVNTIANSAFFACTGLTNVTIPGSITNIGATFGNYGDQAFAACTGLQSVFFLGDAPLVGANVFYGVTNATVYYLPGTAGWGPTLGGLPTMLWDPQIVTDDGSLGAGTNGFGFNITGTTNLPLVVEGCTDLVTSIWQPLQNIGLTNGACYFSDPDWTNLPVRIYRLRWP